MSGEFNVNISNEQLEEYRKKYDAFFETYSKDNKEFREFFEKHPEKKEAYMWKLIDSNAFGEE